MTKGLAEFERNSVTSLYTKKIHRIFANFLHRFFV
jgi:hypothetical protein